MTAALRFGSALALALVLVTAAVTGCRSAPVKYENPAPGTYDASVSKQVKSRACGIQMSFIPMRTNSRQSRAYTALGRGLPGAVFVNVKQQESWSYIVIGIKFCTLLTATAHPSNEPPPKQDPWGRGP